MSNPSLADVEATLEPYRFYRNEVNAATGSYLW